jgi:hypothetical protein
MHLAADCLSAVEGDMIDSAAMGPEQLALGQQLRERDKRLGDRSQFSR